MPKVSQLYGLLLPENMVIGNLGADHPLENCQKAVAMLSADALELHLNAVPGISYA